MQEVLADAPATGQPVASSSQELPGGSQGSGGMPREDSPIQGLVRGYSGGSGEGSETLQSLRERQASLQGEQVPSMVHVQALQLYLIIGSPLLNGPL